MQGNEAAKGPMSRIMPAYISSDREKATQNGEEAIIEYLLLCKCNILIHNGASLARTVLLSCTKLKHINTNPNNKLVNRLNKMIRLTIQEISSNVKKLNKRFNKFKNKRIERLRRKIKNSKKYLNV